MSPKLVLAFSLSVVVLIAAVVVVGVAIRSHNSNVNTSVPLAPGVTGHVSPLPDTALTPKGWAPFELGDVQVSVPGTWTELIGAACPGHISPDGRQADDPGCRTAYATMQPSSKKAVPNARSSVVNGISVVLGKSGRGPSTIYIERALGVDIHAEGAIAQQILGTLTYSPLSVLLDSNVHGSSTGWRDITYDGLSFRVPRSLRVAGSVSTESCTLYRNTLVLVSPKAANSDICGYGGTPGASVVQSEGFSAVSVASVGTGPVNLFLAKTILESDPCMTREQSKICFAPPAQQQFETVFGLGSDALSAFVFPPGKSAPISVEIGLPDSGLTALEILDSIRPATSSISTHPSSTVPQQPSGEQSTATTRAATQKSVGSASSNG